MTGQNKKYQLFQIVKSIPLDEIIHKVINESPSKIRGEDSWYISFLRAKEQTPSLKVNTKKNVWSDYGQGIGGNSYDLLKTYFRTTDIELIAKILQPHFSNYFLFEQSEIAKPKMELEEKPKNEITKISQISHPALIKYLESREIHLKLAHKYCQEVWYKNNNKEYFAVGFKNRSGYELRNKLFKGCTAKDITFIDNGSIECNVFEGFFNFLSFFELGIGAETNSNHLILNSINNFSKADTILKKHNLLSLYMDNDSGGYSILEKIEKLKYKYKNEATLYQGFNDLNDYLISRRNLKEKKIKET